MNVSSRRSVACIVCVVFGSAHLAAQSTGTWITTAPYPLFVSEHNATVVDNRIYVAGGFAGTNRNFTGTTNGFFVYDPANDRWSALPALPKRLHHFGIATLDDKVYITGGYTDDDFELDNKSAYVFDPRAAGGGSWTAIADLPVERAAHSSVAVGGRLFVIGGVGSDASAVRAYNPATNTWDSGRAPLPTPREHLTAAVVNDRIYVISGRWSAGNVGTVEEYTPATNTWRTRASIPTPRSGITSGVINGRIHVTAGEGHPSGITLASHEVYDPANDTWTTLPGMPTGRHGLASGVANGRWYVIGGGLLEGGGTFESLSNVVEAFDPGGSVPPAPEGDSRLVNLSVLTSLAAGESFSVGVVVGGTGTVGNKPVLVRAVGPSLTPFIGAGAIADPRLELFRGTTLIAQNDDWGGGAELTAAMAGVGAFAFGGTTSRDAAALANLTAGDHLVRVSAAANGTGVVLAEVYERPVAGGFTLPTPRLMNLSVLKQVGSGLTVGFVVAGTGSRVVLIRAIGPTLGNAPFNLGGVVADPQLVLFAGSQRIGENNDWGGTVALSSSFAHAGAFALPGGSRDAAMTVPLPAGNYSVQVSGVGGANGLALVEVYELR